MLTGHASQKWQGIRGGIKRPTTHVTRGTSAVSPNTGLPTGPDSTIRQAETAIATAFRDGVVRQMVELPLPLTGATELDDWPGGIQQQFKVARPMVEQLLGSVSRSLQMDGEFKGKVLDDGDAVAAWTNGSVEAVLFPTGDTLNAIEKRAENKELVLLVNPQWRTGQVISDFGFFGRRRKEEFVATFETVYSVTSKRAAGRYIWVRQTQAEGSHLFVDDNGQAVFVEQYDAVPEYKVLEARAKEWIESQPS